MALRSKLLMLLSVIPFFLPSSSTCFPTERHALLQFKAALNYPPNSNSYSDYTNLRKWEEVGDCCLWHGISCHNTTHHVIGVYVMGYYGMEGGVISESLCTLTSLASISLPWMGLTGALPPCLANLSSLIELHLYGNRLSPNIPLSSSLAILSFSFNNLQGESVLTHICMLTNLRTVELSYNQLNGRLPPCLGNLSSLEELLISENHLFGRIPYLLGNISSLQFLDVSHNSLSGVIPYSLGNLSLLRNLDLSYNQLSGSIPDSLGSLSMLGRLDLSHNQLNGTLPSSFSRLASLTFLIADGNAFNSIASSPLPASLQHLYLSLDDQQIISEDFLDNLMELKELILSNCVLNINTTWVPSFQLSRLSITSCKVDGNFPLWIHTQFSLVELELVDNNLTGEIPSWLMDMNIVFINLTKNHLQGNILLNTSAVNPLTTLDVSRNALSGQIPSIWPPNINLLLLNDNLLTGNIPPHLEGISSLKIVNFANNHLSGIIPSSLSNCSNLQMLNLKDNHLRGKIPYEFSKMSKLQTLVIKNNHLSCPFPLFIANCTELYFLDVGENLFGGHIPKSIGNISQLKVLTMRRNKFDGSIPVEIGQLNNLQILDLSSNQLSGFVPSNIFSLQAMLVETHQEFSEVQFKMDTLSNFLKYTYNNELTMDSKGRDERYTYFFFAMMAIDLSENQLSGNLPFDLGKLKGLKILNISMNNFSGVIPNSIVQMNWLETLDFSTNKFYGQIPIDLGSLNYLEYLNFSNNHLTGSIPQGGHMATFSESSYSGNPNLWGCPLPKKCSWPKFASSPPSIPINEEEESKESVGYDIGVVLSCVIGFTIMLVFILLSKKFLKGVDFVLKVFFPRFRNWTL